MDYYKQHPEEDPARFHSGSNSVATSRANSTSSSPVNHISSEALAETDPIKKPKLEAVQG